MTPVAVLTTFLLSVANLTFTQHPVIIEEPVQRKKENRKERRKNKRKKRVV